MENRKLFISYSWTSDGHMEWVSTLATELREVGVDVIFDKWDLKEGHDANAFMERMVTDPEVTKVVLVSDEAYARKADGRSGGVGTETQIISAEVYAKRDQNKFVAVLPERGPDGEAFVPTYYKSRIYIDLSNQDVYGGEFERLVRWIFDKPLNPKPPLGRIPSYITDDAAPSLGTGAALRRVLDALRGSKAHAMGALDDHLAALAASLERFRLTSSDSREFDDKVVDSISAMGAVRTEVDEVVTAACRFADSREAGVRIHRFLEKLLPLMDVPERSSSWNERDFDNFRFLAWELYLLCVSTALKTEAFAIAGQLISQPFYVDAASRKGQDAMSSYQVFQREVSSLEHRKARLSLDRYSLQADLIKQRSDAAGHRFSETMQADFLLFLRSRATNSEFAGWYPETLIYQRTRQPFEFFARCASTSHMEQVLNLMGLDFAGMTALVEHLTSHGGLRMHQSNLNVRAVLGFDHWGSAA